MAEACVHRMLLLRADTLTHTAALRPEDVLAADDLSLTSPTDVAIAETAKREWLNPSRSRF